MLARDQYQDQGIDKQLENTETFHRTLDNISLSPEKFHEYFLDQWLLSLVAIVLAILFTKYYSGKMNNQYLTSSDNLPT